MQLEFKQKISNEELYNSISEYVQTSKSYFVDVVKPLFSKYIDMYNGVFNHEEFNCPSGSYVSKDIQVTVFSIIPDIIKLVFTDEPVKISPQGNEDVELANKMQILLNYQVVNQNNYSEIMETVTIDSLVTGMGIIKCTWDKEIKKEEFVEILDEQSLCFMQSDYNIEIKSIEFRGVNALGINFYNVTYTKDVVVKNQPVYSRIDYRELFFDPLAKNTNEVRYYIHRRLVSADYIRRQADLGIFNKDEVTYILNNQFETGAYTVIDYDDDDNIDYTSYQTNNEYNKSLDTMMLYEFWGKFDINQDGYLEDVIISFIGDRILSVQENTYKMYPFFIFNPYYNIDNILGKSISELISPVQNIKTVLTREYLLNVRKNNNRKIFYKLDNFINPMQLETDEQYVALNESADPRNVFITEPYDVMSNNIQNLISYFDNEVQKISGISDLKGGVRSSSNTTATEATIKYEASNSKIQLIAVHFSLVMKELYKFIIFQNKQFLDNSVVLRLFNNSIEINPSDFENVEFDLNVSVNFGNGTKETRLAAYQTAYKMLGEVVQLGLTDTIKIRNLISKMLEEIGLKDTDSYLISETDLLNKQQEIKSMEKQALINNPDNAAVGSNIDIQIPQNPVNTDKLPLKVY